MAAICRPRPSGGGRQTRQQDPTHRIGGDDRLLAVGFSEGTKDSLHKRRFGITNAGQEVAFVVDTLHLYVVEAFVFKERWSAPGRSSGSWSGTRRRSSLAWAVFGRTVLVPGPL